MDLIISNKMFEVYFFLFYGGIDFCRSGKVLNSLFRFFFRFNVMDKYV